MTQMDEVQLLLGMDLLSQHGRIELKTTRGRVEGKFLIMQMDEVQILLDMDLLSQHGRIVIDFLTKGPARLLSEVAMGEVITEEEGPEILIVVSDSLIPPNTQKVIRVMAWKLDGRMKINC